MSQIEDVARAIRQRDSSALYELMFTGALPVLKGSFATETFLWDYKRDCPAPNKDHAAAWAEIAVDVLAFHNNSGGVLIFGIRDDNFTFTGATQRLDSKLFNDQLRKYLSDRIWVEYYRFAIQGDQRYLGMAVVSPRGPILERFRANSPTIAGKMRFAAGESAVRENDSSRILKKSEADLFARQMSVPTLGRIYAVDEPFFRVLNPDYPNFVFREQPCNEVEAGLSDPRASVTSIVGVGGTGKTALATWSALKAYDSKQFSFIASITAKDRELTSTGIKALEPGLLSFEALLNNIVDVLNFPECKSLDIASKESEVRKLIEKSDGLLFVDNLETVDDARIIQFLDSLPVGVRALTTSRRTSVRVSLHPVTVGGLTSPEVTQFVKVLSKLPGFAYLTDLAESECEAIGNSCDGLPLAIRWVLSRCRSAAEALSFADSITVSSRHGEELLEFCFRRLFDAMTGSERAVLQVLTLFQRPVSAEALLVGSGIAQLKLSDATEDLTADSVVNRIFDSESNDYAFTLLPVTRAFVRNQMAKEHGLEDRIRKRLADYFEARDIANPKERIVVRELRQGKGGSETALVDLAAGAERRGDDASAKSLYEQALSRNPSSWRAARQFAEFNRHKTRNVSEALRLYELAAGNAPTRGPDRALIFREWGMLLRDSGDPEATDRAISCFETALEESPNDVVAKHALAVMLVRKGVYGRIVQLLEPLRDHPSERTKDLVRPLLLLAYERTGELLKASALKSEGVVPWKL